MSKKPFNGPLLFIILGGLVVLVYRYLPSESLLEKVKAGRGDAQAIEQAAPTVPTPIPRPPAVVAPEVRSPPPPVVLQAEVSPMDKTAPRVAVPTEVWVAKPTLRQEPVVPAGEPPTTVAAAGKPEPVPEPVLPNLRIFVQADGHERAGLGDLSVDREAVQGEDPNMKFREYLAEGREGLEQICMRARAQRLLLADVEISAVGFSNVDSAYWPEVSYIAINCGDGRGHKSPKKRLEPHRLDTFEFQQQFSRRSQEFIASQGYFLKP